MAKLQGTWENTPIRQSSAMFPELTATLSVTGRTKIGRITETTIPIQTSNNRRGKPRHNNNNMAKYILVKKVKGKKYEYQVIDVDSKAIVSKRTSAREYVACTADGSFYFGRLDLIGKGDHGKRLSHTAEILANPEKAYKKMVAYFTPDYRKQWIAENPAEQWISRNVESATKEKERLNAIAYLQ